MNNKLDKIIPVLRFPEFENLGEWEAVYLGVGEKSISTFVKQKILINTLTLENYISTENILPDYAGVKDASKLPRMGAFTQFKIGDILVSNIRPYLKKVWSANKNGGASNDVLVIRAKSKVIASFLTHLLKNDAFINYVMIGAKGVKMPRGDVYSIKKYPLYYPKLKEQQKIADCLSSLDNLISTQSKKLTALQQHKKGLMQNLFPADGETCPKRRFPEFIGEWEIKKLAIGLDAKSSLIAKNKLSFQKSGYPIYGADGILGYIDSYAKNNDYIAIVKDGSGVGRLFYCKKKSSLLGTLNYLASKDEKKFNLKWFYFLLQTINFKPFIKGSGIPHIYYKDYSELEIALPKPKEQQKIAYCLSSLDNLINTQTKKLTTLQKHKKGLMQNLFPNNETLE